MIIDLFRCFGLIATHPRYRRAENNKEYVKPFDETEEVFMDRIRRSKEQGRNLFFEEWPLFVHEWETDPDVIL